MDRPIKPVPSSPEYSSSCSGRPVSWPTRKNSNRGTCASRRLALGQARGEFVAFLDADDRYLPEKLPRHVGLLGKPVERSWSTDPSPHRGRVGEGGRRIGGGGSAWARIELTYDPDCNRRVHGGQPSTCNSTVVCRRMAVFPGDLPPSMVFQFEDWLQWSLIAARGSFPLRPRPSTAYRYHPGSFTYGQKGRPALWRFAHIEYLAALAGRLPGAPARQRAGRILAAEILSLARAECSPADPKAETRASLNVLAAIFQPAAAEWLRLRLRSSLGWRTLRYLAGLIGAHPK